ncbi:calcium-binding protein CML24-like [Cryptomeria japonica]|uniref:calcium-binding protein CML24-like n=1 Tax=Cryptomeria japonica TaxID=3369 RepID=UPI0027DA9BCF|nr:calcium-binding protein CML24-like [Cryptomeria japonica]XP_057848398.2 calcium-binding protein CML24-like [Cryptomeria japonica]
MGLPWFASRKNTPAEPQRRRSQGFNIVSSRSQPGKSPSRWKTSGLWRRKSSSRSDASAGDKLTSLASAAELESVFNKFDADGDGKISVSELRNVMRSLGHDATEDELRLMMAEADSDGDGHVDLAEFVALNTRGVDNTERLQDLQEAFKMFDVNGDGSISAHELESVLGRLGETSSLNECHHMIAKVDADRDGKVNFDEFLAMMSAPIAH